MSGRRAILIALLLVVLVPAAARSAGTFRLTTNDLSGEGFRLTLERLERLAPKKAVVQAHGEIGILLHGQATGPVFVFDCRVDAPEGTLFRVEDLDSDDGASTVQQVSLAGGRLGFSVTGRQSVTVAGDPLDTWRTSQVIRADLASGQNWTFYWCDVTPR